MANRYWVGGSATWDSTAGTKWAATSGGAGGQTVPTTGDFVFFDGASGAVSVSAGLASAVLGGIDFTGFTGSFTGSSARNVAGNVTFSSGMTMSMSGLWTITGTCSFTSAGKAISGGLTMNTGANVTLQDAMTAGAITLTAGTFNTNSQSVACTILSSNNSNTRTLDMGSSTITITSGSSSFNFDVTTNLSTPTNTATISLFAADADFEAPNRNWGGMSLSSSGSGTFSCSNGGTFANITITGTATKTHVFSTNGNITCTGTFTVNGNSPTNRVLVRASNSGSPETITAAAVSVDNADFMDITAAGAGSWNLSSATAVGDCHGNSGITFTTASSFYFADTGGDFNTAANWRIGSASGSVGRVPLPQDTAVLSAGSGAATSSSTSNNSRFGSLDALNFNSTMQVAFTAQWFGDFRFGGTQTSASAWTLSGRNGHAIEMQVGAQWDAGGLVVSTGVSSGVYTAESDLAMTALTINTGDVDLDGYDLTFDGNGLSINSSGHLIATGSTINVGSGGQITTSGGELTGGTFYFTRNSTSTHLSMGGTTDVFGSPNFIIDGITSQGTYDFGSGNTFGTLTFSDYVGSPGIAIMSGTTNTFSSVYVGNNRTVRFPGSTTTSVTSFTVGTDVILSASSGTATLTKLGGGLVDLYPYAPDVLNQTVTPANTWYAGDGAGDLGGNTGWIFGNAPVSATAGVATASAASANAAVKQLVTPTGDVLTTGWADQAAGTSNLYAVLDDGTTPNDADYVRTTA